MRIFLLAPLVLGAWGSVSSRAQNRKPLRLALSSWPGWFVWFWAREQGLFKKYGVKVENLLAHPS